MPVPGKSDTESLILYEAAYSVAHFFRLSC
jgi:hypothetical protein